jgi:small multidrug resistance family-3 protein
VLILFLAALLEAGGDALIRAGLHAAGARRAGLMLLGAFVLFAYGCTVNTPQWTFGRLLGVYVVFFFVIAQVIGFVAFGQKPSTGVLIGGVFIVIGGIVISIS